MAIKSKIRVIQTGNLADLETVLNDDATTQEADGFRVHDVDVKPWLDPTDGSSIALATITYHRNIGDTSTLVPASGGYFVGLINTPPPVLLTDLSALQSDTRYVLFSVVDKPIYITFDGTDPAEPTDTGHFYDAGAAFVLSREMYAAAKIASKGGIVSISHLKD